MKKQITKSKNLLLIGDLTQDPAFYVKQFRKNNFTLEALKTNLSWFEVRKAQTGANFYNAQITALTLLIAEKQQTEQIAI